MNENIQRGVISYRGKLIKDMTKEELIIIVNELAEELHTAQIQLISSNQDIFDAFNKSSVFERIFG